MENDLYHKLIRHILALLLCTCVWGSNGQCALANDYHAKLLKEVLIKPGIALSERAEEKLKMLQCASYLCIDQFNNNDPKRANGDQKKLDWLRERVNGLPKSINEINPDSGEKQLSGKNHRSFTHRGWGFPYWIPGNGGDRAKSKLRMKIMQNTVQTVFDFQLESDLEIINWAQSLIDEKMTTKKWMHFVDWYTMCMCSAIVLKTKITNRQMARITGRKYRLVVLTPIPIIQLKIQISSQSCFIFCLS